MKTNEKRVLSLIESDILQEFEMLELKGGTGDSSGVTAGAGCTNATCPGAGNKCTNTNCGVTSVIDALE